MQRLGASLSSILRPGDIVFLQGQLGAGKTTLVRGIFNAWHHKGFIKSPTYQLIECYTLPLFQVVHVDLYRLATSEEYEHIGLSDYLTENSILLVEWPEKAESQLPLPTLSCHIQIINGDREVTLIATSERWKTQLELL